MTSGTPSRMSSDLSSEQPKTYTYKETRKVILTRYVMFLPLIDIFFTI